MKSDSLCALLWRLLSWCNLQNIVVQAHHILGRLNVIAELKADLSQPGCPDRMVSRQGNHLPDFKQMAHALNRPVGHQVQQETIPVCVPRPGQGRLGSGR